MGLIKEPLNVDFYFEDKEMTEEDQKRVSDYINRQKNKKKLNKIQPERKELLHQNR